MPATITVNADIESAAATGAADATHFSYWDAANGGNCLWASTTAITNNPDALGSGDKYEIASGTRLFTVPNPSNGGTNRMAERQANGMKASSIWVQYHSGAPGAAGTANVISTVARTEIPSARMTVART